MSWRGDPVSGAWRATKEWIDTAVLLLIPIALLAGIVYLVSLIPQSPGGSGDGQYDGPETCYSRSGPYDC